MTERRVMHLDAADEVWLWLAAMDEARGRTLALLDGTISDGSPVAVGDDIIDRGSPNTIGSILYHVAAIEADWLLDEICGTPEDISRDLFPWAVREQDGVLTPVTGTVADHLERLATVRALFRERVGTMSPESFRTVNARANYDVSPIWVVHHLLQHEAEHRAEIGRALTT